MTPPIITAGAGDSRRAGVPVHNQAFSRPRDDLPRLQGTERRQRRRVLHLRTRAHRAHAGLDHRHALRDPEPARQGRHGHGLQGPRPHARRDGRDQGAARRVREHRRDGQALPPRDQARAQGLAPQRLPHPRVRRGRRRALHLDGVRRGHRHQAARARQGRLPRAGGGVRRLDPDRRRPAGDPRRRHHPPRPQDLEHHARQRAGACA